MPSIYTVCSISKYLQSYPLFNCHSLISYLSVIRLAFVTSEPYRLVAMDKIQRYTSTCYVSKREVIQRYLFHCWCIKIITPLLPLIFLGIHLNSYQEIKGCQDCFYPCFQTQTSFLCSVCYDWWLICRCFTTNSKLSSLKNKWLPLQPLLRNDCWMTYYQWWNYVKSSKKFSIEM